MLSHYVVISADAFLCLAPVEFAVTGTPLLTVSTPVGLHIGQSPGDIRVNNQPLAGDLDLNNLGLQVSPGRTLALVGGDVFLQGAHLTALDGQIVLTGLAEAGTIGLERVDDFLQLQMPATRRSNVAIQNGSYLIANAPAPFSSFSIQAHRLKVTGNSTLTAGVFDFTPPGFVAGGFNIDVSDRFTLHNSNIYSAVAPGGFGTAGDISITTPNLHLMGGSRIISSIGGQGTAGDVNLSAQRITVDGTGSRLINGIVTLIGTYNLETGVGDAGALRIATQDLLLINGGIVTASNEGQGNGGEVVIRATDRVRVDGVTPGFFGIVSLIGSTIEEGGVGHGGTIRLTTPVLHLSRGGAITARVLGEGNGGNIRLNVHELQAEIGGQVSTTSQRGGNAGNITIIARDRISLTGRDPSFAGRAGVFGEFNRFGGEFSGFYADTSARATGRGGDLTVRTPQLLLSDTATLSVNGAGAGGAGNLNLRVDDLLLTDHSRLTAEVKHGDRGNITLQANTVSLRRNSQITTAATQSASGGDISINTDFLMGFENSDIIARAQQGQGGNIAITSQSVFGLQPRLNLTADNDINASSQLGLNGVVDINTPNIDANGGLVALPHEVLDSSQQMADRCGALQDNRFVISGRGGLPSTPEQIESNRPWYDLRDLSEFSEIPAPQSLPSSDQWVEADHLRDNGQGQLQLMAAVASQSIKYPATCVN